MARRRASLAIVGVPADVSVELAVCCLLLGDSEKAEDVLALAPGSSVQQADPAVRSFVLVRASDHVPLLLVCLYAYPHLYCHWDSVLLLQPQLKALLKDLKRVSATTT